MDIRNILILSMVKGIGPAFIKKNCHRLINDSSCDQIVKESKPEELDNLVTYAKTANEIMSDCEANDIKMISIKGKITFTEEVLGTASANKEIHETFIASNAPDAPSNSR